MAKEEANGSFLSCLDGVLSLFDVQMGYRGLNMRFLRENPFTRKAGSGITLPARQGKCPLSSPRRA